jgi:hypothetical protein
MRMPLANRPSPSTEPAPDGVLQRKCACGNHTLSGAQCPACRGRRTLQTRLSIGAADDAHEREADRIAQQVIAEPASERARPARAPVQVQRVRDDGADATREVPDSVERALAESGRPMPSALREDMEQRFGHDFSGVRLHHGGLASRSASEIGAEAYTVGRHVVFGAGRYDPAGHTGRALLAHELTHVLQQSAGTAPRVQRAVVPMGAVNIEVDYGNIVHVPAGGEADRIVAAITALTGAPPSAIDEATIRALAGPAQRWLMHALDLLDDNRAAAPALNLGVAVQRLLAHAPTGLNPPTPDMDNRFVFEAMHESGWSSEALGGRLSAPGAADRTAINAIVNPPPTSGSASDPLDLAEFRRRLDPAVRQLLNALDPGRWTNRGTRSIAAFQSLGDVIQEEARTFFAPYAEAAIGNLFHLRPAWRASANIFDVGTLVPTRNQRIGYLLNRAEIIGRASTAVGATITDLNIFADTHFDPTRDDAELLALVTAIEADATMQAIVDRLIQHTGRQSGSGTSTRIGLVTEYNADRANACQDHWAGIDTLCHEVLHALSHPDFDAVASGGSVRFPQVIREGFTEVLGVQLFNQRVAPKAASNAAFKSLLEGGVAGAPCPAPPAATIGYGSAGSGAESIRARIGDDRFRAAYFLGRPTLAGLP